MAVPAYVTAGAAARGAYVAAIAVAPDDAWSAHLATLPADARADAKAMRRREKNRQSAKRSAARKHSRSNTTEALCITKSVELFRAKERIRVLQAASFHYAAAAATAGHAVRPTDAIAVCGGYCIARPHTVLLVRTPANRAVMLNGSEGATRVAIGGPLAPIVVGAVEPHCSWWPSLTRWPSPTRGQCLVAVAWSAATGAVLGETVTDGPVVATAASSRGAAAITATTLYTLPVSAQPGCRALAVAATAVAVDERTDTVVWGTADALWAMPLSTPGEAQRLFALAGSGPIALAVSGTAAIVAGWPGRVQIYTTSMEPCCVTVTVDDVLDVAVDDVVAVLSATDVRTLTLAGESIKVAPRPAGATHVIVQGGAPVCF